MPRFFYLSLLMLFCGSAIAANSQQDYAYEALLEQSDQDLQRVVLPIEVILALTRSNRSDLAVFNVNGQMLPHSVVRAARGTSEHERVLPFHEFGRFQRDRSKTVTTREQNQQSGNLSELQITETISVQSQRKDFLIELSPDRNTPHFDRIDLQWTHEPADQLLKVKVEVGNELDNLRVIKNSKSLTNLESDDRSWRSISGIPRNKKYLRLTAVNDVKSFELQQVRGHYRKSEPAPTLTHRIQTQRVEIDGADYFYFKYPSRVVAEHLRIIPPQSHSVIKADIYASQADFDTSRGLRFNIRQHNIDDPEVAASRPIGMRGRGWNKIWIKSRVDLPSPPDVQLIYPQYEVLFLGDGQGPYTLAWGNHEAEAPVADLNALLDGSAHQAQQRAALVSMGTIQESGGAERLAPKPALPWQKWLLWALLILAAVITGRMALKLYHEMDASDESRGKA